MFSVVFRTAFRLDAWLHRRLGRGYRALLSVGLVIDIVHRILETPRHISERPRLIGVVLAVVMEVALLIHQLGELHVRFAGKGAHPAPPAGEDG